jgi:hypothetical protein
VRLLAWRLHDDPDTPSSRAVIQAKAGIQCLGDCLTTPDDHPFIGEKALPA